MIWLGLFPMTLSAQNKLYLNLGSHNETNDPFIYNHVSSSTDFNAFKPYLQKLMDSVIAKKVKWNMQVESNFILGVIRWDNGASSTGDILERADTSSYIEVDPHNHFIPGSGLGTNPYNYSDLTKLLDSVGIHDWQVMGGLLWDSTNWSHTYDHWDLWNDSVAGNVFPDWKWRADIIWGPGTLSHADDINGFGLWKPSGATSHSAFTTHNPAKHSVCIGNGCAWVVSDTTTDPTWIINEIRAFTDYAQSQPYSPDKMYAATIQTNFRDYADAGYLDRVMQILNGIQDYVDAGKIEYKTIQEKYDYWFSLHAFSSSSYHLEECDNISVGVSSVSRDHGLEVFPIPASHELHIKTTYSFFDYSIYDLTGQLIQSNANQNCKTINISDLSAGLYVLQLNHIDGASSVRFVKE